MAEALWEQLSLVNLRRILYLSKVEEVNFPDKESVPSLLDACVPWTMVLMLLEFLISIVDGSYKRRFATHECMTNLGLGQSLTFLRLTCRSWDYAVYQFCYDHFNIITLPWNSWYSYILALVGIDFGYYCFHRVIHGCHFLWASHSVHHSAERFNLTVAARNNVIEFWALDLFHAPLTLFLHPGAILGHVATNKLFQFWLHTEVVDNIGIFGYVFNNPSFHRVHHGRNPYCIDKNFGAVLIIWDRLFGTFEEERRGEPIAYGLVHSAETFDPIKLQVAPWKEALWDKPRTFPGFMDRLLSPFRSPGWSPQGNLPISDVEGERIRFNPPMSNWMHYYAWFQMLLLNSLYMFAAKLYISNCLERPELLLWILYHFGTLQTLGFLYELRKYARELEIVRCFIVMAVIQCHWGFHHLETNQLIFVFGHVVSLLFLVGKQCDDLISGYDLMYFLGLKEKEKYD